MPSPKLFNILIADKDQNTRDLIKECVLTVYKKANILEAHDGTNAEYKIANQAFDLVIITQKIPGKDGIKLLKSFKTLEKNKPRCMVLITEDKNFDEKLKEDFKPLFFIAKPCEAENLQVLLRETVLVLVMA